MGNKTSHDVLRQSASLKKTPLVSTSSDSMRRKSDTSVPSNDALFNSPAGDKPDGIAKLAKELILRSKEQTKEGISLDAFSKYVCHGCTFLGTSLFRDFQKLDKKNKDRPAVLSKECFVTGSQKIVQLIGDEQLLKYYVQIFANDDDIMQKEDVDHLFQSCYKLSAGPNASATVSEDVMQTVLAAMFHGKNALSTKFVIKWVEENCPRIVTWMHRHLVHRLTVGFRVLQQNQGEADEGSDVLTHKETPVVDTSPLSFPPSSPTHTILSRNLSFLLKYKQASDAQADTEKVVSQMRLHPMHIWLLGCTLPVVYTRPAPVLANSPTVNGIVLMDPRTFITRMIASTCPSNWTLLYDSENDGLSLNRFEHHVMNYRGPTVVFLFAEGNRVFCLAVDQPWKESIQFWGASSSVIVQLSPEYRVLDRGEKMMYYNTSVRGYPFGIQMGTDHRHVCLEIDKEFTRLSHRKIPYRLEGFQVWGCGTVEQREAQLEHKKWELKQVEKSRNTKLTATEWNDHPDKCLLEMASHRPNYSQFGNA